MENRDKRLIKQIVANSIMGTSYTIQQDEENADDHFLFSILQFTNVKIVAIGRTLAILFLETQHSKNMFLCKVILPEKMHSVNFINNLEILKNILKFFNTVFIMKNTRTIVMT